MSRHRLDVAYTTDLPTGWDEAADDFVAAVEKYANEKFFDYTVRMLQFSDFNTVAFDFTNVPREHYRGFILRELKRLARFYNLRYYYSAAPLMNNFRNWPPVTFEIVVADNYRFPYAEQGDYPWMAKRGAFVARPPKEDE